MREKLYKTWFSERETKKLKKLDPALFSKVQEYISNLENLKKNLEKDDNQTRELVETEINNISEMLEDLKKCRKEKIVQFVFEGEPVDKVILTREELAFFEALQAPLEKKEDEQKPIPVEKISTSDSAVERSQSVPLTLVRITQDAPASMGSDLLSYGPFKKEDIIYLPSDNAKIKIQNNAAKEITISKK
ncbi:MAG: DNA replication complex subunit Gins51 [Candidatus Helarchaeota archaeon]